ncbi:MAG: ribonuclease III [Hyphomicrobiales bacterium]
MARFNQTQYLAIADRLGYDFHDRAVLRHALTHASGKGKTQDYERLEFLGDRVLGLVIAEKLYRDHPQAREGDMSGRHSALVRRETCAEVGRTIGITDFIVVGESERAKGMNLNATVVGDVMEALIAAIYLDGGLEAARAFILRHWQPVLDAPRVSEKDPKTFLQEWALARSLPIPTYRILSREGLQHDPVFEVSVEIKGKDPVQATGKSKRAAEQGAAAAFLKRERIRP